MSACLIAYNTYCTNYAQSNDLCVVVVFCVCFYILAANFTGVAFVYTRKNVTYRYENVSTIVDNVETQDLTLVKVLPFLTFLSCLVLYVIIINIFTLISTVYVFMHLLILLLKKKKFLRN